MEKHVKYVFVELIAVFNSWLLLFAVGSCATVFKLEQLNMYTSVGILTCSAEEWHAGPGMHLGA
jgi:hypothetical protein